VQKEDAAKEAVKKALGVLNDQLMTRTYLVGDAVTLADIITFCNLIFGYTMVRIVPTARCDPRRVWSRNGTTSLQAAVFSDAWVSAREGAFATSSPSVDNRTGSWPTRHPPTGVDGERRSLWWCRPHRGHYA